MDWYKEFPRQEFLDKIAGGKTEMEALEQINSDRKIPFGKNVLIQMQVKRNDFKEALEDAKKVRADVWFNGIIKSVGDTTIGKEEVPAEKLKFEQRKYLAAIDNPDKYSEKKSLDLNIGINIFAEMKALDGAAVKKIMLESDPFALAVEAESKVIIDEDNEEDIFA